MLFLTQNVKQFFLKSKVIPELLLNKIHIKEYSTVTFKETMPNKVSSF